jgi:hypothetical protein
MYEKVGNPFSDIVICLDSSLEMIWSVNDQLLHSIS